MRTGSRGSLKKQRVATGYWRVKNELMINVGRRMENMGMSFLIT